MLLQEAEGYGPGPMQIGASPFVDVVVPLFSALFTIPTMHFTFEGTIVDSALIVAPSAILASVLKTGSIDKLDLPTVRAIEKLQADAVSKNYEFSITTSEWHDGKLRITPQTHYRRSSEVIITQTKRAYSQNEMC